METQNTKIQTSSDKSSNTGLDNMQSASKQGKQATDEAQGSQGSGSSGGAAGSTTNGNGGGIGVQQLSLPKGGGALAGTGEKVQIQDFTGSSGFSLPVAVSPCRGIAPSLGVSYSSGSGNSEFGLGWSIGISQISRKTNKGIPQYDERDTFLLNNAQDLVPSNDASRTTTLNGLTYQVKTYLVRFESDYPLIEYWQSIGLGVGKSFWKVTDKGHNISIFGATSQAKLYNPANQEQVFAWLVEEVYNTAGDHQVWFYKREDGANVPAAVYENNRVKTANLYLERVRYGLNAPGWDSLVLNNRALVNNARSWHFEVVMNYGEYNIDPSNNNPYTPVRSWQARSDAFSQYHAGFEIRNYRLCQNSLMFHRFAELGDKPVLVSTINYNYRLNAAGINELISSNSTGYQYDTQAKTYKTASTPATEFGYIDFTPQNGEFTPITRANSKELPALNEVSGYELVDLFGEGLPGIFYNDHTTTYYSRAELPDQGSNVYTPEEKARPLYRGKKEALKAGLEVAEDLKYQPWEQLKSFPLQKGMAPSDSTLMDITGNGKLDLVVTSFAMKGYFEAQPDESWQPFKAFKKFATDHNAPSQSWIDMNGRGLNDLVQLTNYWVRIYPSNRDQGLAAPIIVYKNKAGETDKTKNPADLPVALEYSPRKTIMFADLDGSGRQHLVQIVAQPIGNGQYQLQLCYWPNLGYGRFGAKVTMGNLPIVDSKFDLKYLYLTDLDGTGTSDLVYLKADRMLIYSNHNGNSFSDPITILFPSTLKFDETVKVSFADIMGKGTSCLVLSDPKPASQHRHLYYDFCQSKKPYLACSINDNQGARSEIEYASSVDFYLKDKAAGLPWLTRSPFPVMVVKQVTTIDEIAGSRYVTQYAYRHGYYDGDEREFRGFGRVDVQNAEYFAGQTTEFYTAPALMRTWYHTGWQAGNGVSQMFAAEYYQGDTAAFASEDSSINVGGSLDPETINQAYTALAGSALRSELYGLDDQQIPHANPYTVSESNYAVTLKQAIGNNKYAVFKTNPQTSIAYNYECNPEDPQISQTFTLLDDYNNPISSCAVAYPRRANPEALPDQLTLKAICSTSYFIAPNLTPDNYLIGAPCEGKSYDVTTCLPVIASNKAYTFSQVSGIMNSLALGQAVANAVLLSWSKVIYADPETSELLPFGQVKLPVLIGEQRSAMFAPEDCAAFNGVLSDNEFEGLLAQGLYVKEMDSYWWNQGLRVQYDPERFYLPLSATDPAGNTTSYTYEDYSLFMIHTKDALGNTARAEDLNYQRLQAQTLIDPNGNISQVAFDALGQVIYTSFFGHEGTTNVGFAPISNAPTVVPTSVQQILASPSAFIGNMASFFYYDLFAWQNRKEPCLTLSIAAQEYPTSGRSQVLHIGIGYSDGMGRAVQSKAKLEGGLAWHYDEAAGTITEINSTERWLTSGAVIYDNKGNTIKAYESYYSDTASYISPDTILAQLIQVDSKFGITPIMHYDPLNRVYKVTTPKGFISRSTWTPWEQTSYDPNDAFDASIPYCLDNLGSNLDPAARYYDNTLPASARTSLAAMQEYLGITDFIDTPSKVINDNLGRAIVGQAIRKPALDPIANPNGEVLSTYSTYDIKGNLLTTSDPRLGHLATPIASFTNTCGFGNTVMKVESVDAGTKWTLNNIFGNPIYACDSRKIVVTSTYDQLHRPVSTHVKKAADDDPLVLDQIVNYFIYGDTPGAVVNPETNNLRGQLYQHYDQAGLNTVQGYALTGGVVRSSRQLLKDYTRCANWNNLAAEIANLDPAIYSTSAKYDGMGRVITGCDADGNVTTPVYNLLGQLQALQVKTADDGQITNYVQSITYDAKGQRQTIQYGNNTTTSYTYDPKTYAVTRINTVNSSSGAVLQDLNYTYDPVGNILCKIDVAQDVVYYNNQQVLPAGIYKYDSLYQLITAQGRQQVGSSNRIDVKQRKSWPEDGYSPYHDAKDIQALEAYLEQYTYDNGGNLTKLQHSAVSGSWTRNMILSNKNNRAVSDKLAIGITPDDVDQYFDLNGNQRQLTDQHFLQWNETNNIRQYITVSRASGNNDGEYYVYDSAGQRVRKVAVSYGTGEMMRYTKETIYLGGIEIKRSSQQSLNGGAWSDPVITEEFHTLAISDDTRAIANRHHWLIGSPPSGSTSPIVFYSLSDHLGSATLDVDTSGVIVSVEEYTPYGDSSLFLGTGSALALKTKRYSGKEKDATGLYYYGARYFDPTLMRWLSPDPIGPVDGPNIYLFLNGNPVNDIDINGNFLESLKRWFESICSCYQKPLIDNNEIVEEAENPEPVEEAKNPDPDELSLNFSPPRNPTGKEPTPLLSSLSDFKDEDVLYRGVRRFTEPITGTGIHPRSNTDPHFPPKKHVENSTDKSPFISLTSKEGVALHFAAHGDKKLVVINREHMGNIIEHEELKNLMDGNMRLISAVTHSHELLTKEPIPHKSLLEVYNVELEQPLNHQNFEPKSNLPSATRSEARQITLTAEYKEDPLAKFAGSNERREYFDNLPAEEKQKLLSRPTPTINNTYYLTKISKRK